MRRATDSRAGAATPSAKDERPARVYSTHVPVCSLTLNNRALFVGRMEDALSAVLRTAVKWGHLPENPARGVELPTLKCVRPNGR